MDKKAEFVNYLRLRKYALSTVDSYLGCLSVLMQRFGEYPTVEQLKDFLIAVKNPNTHKQYTATIRHYFKGVLKKRISLDDIPYPRKAVKLSVILSEDEMKRLIDVPKNSKHQLVIYILYGCGLRVGELLNLKLTDIDRGQMCLHIKGAKGNKDRTVGISENLLSFIEKYYRYWQPKEYLFNGQFCLRYTASSINQFLRRYSKQTEINKHVHAHLLRTCFAVHCVNNKVDMGLLQRAMGHSNIKTTQHYTKMSKSHLNISPLNFLPIQKDAAQTIPNNTQ